MKIIVSDIKVSLDTSREEALSLAIKRAGIKKENLKSFKIAKESIDARKKSDICLVYSFVLEVPSDLRFKRANVRMLEEKNEETIEYGNIKLKNRPIVIGAGPCGLYAALTLAKWGFRPIVIERGSSVENRVKKINDFWNNSKLDSECNVQFGEGGAGTFSDGKLTTRINDRRCEQVLEEFYLAGANEEILYKAKPHIGTDVLKKVVATLRNKIISLGGEVYFDSKVTNISQKDGRINGVFVNNERLIECEICIFAIGHSARDTFKMLYDSGIQFQQKPFSIGVRIEHPQEVINKAQYGEEYTHERLGAADYQLFYKSGNRTVYSFCMCPGGIVVASASEPDTIVTNGMSEYARDRANANSALVVSVEPTDFGSNHPLSGIDFQRRWEKLAYEIGGRNYKAPIQKLRDFMLNIPSTSVGKVIPSYTGGVTLANLNDCLPGYVTDAMKEGISAFDRKLKGFAMEDALLTGVETRTSSPVRITRGTSFESLSIAGLYPAGEGAGYAGGIVSAAVDGIKIAEQIIKTYSPK